ncbi:flagellar basal body rod protein FlgB [Anaerohalosphaera lusitana]|uniref:Flagellar basal body rod protein FlgB n=1 Tax=Anaerohalosphaera lusitana TaxID=1936003 RepID=A0A1U9NG29_9BACT|nr:flagellar basal body protein [Anaerohalosphaera lusitana]AQT66891.1 flagellar basal body rod protein FlgB [Anaerohalosphaera lusitana]
MSDNLISFLESGIRAESLRQRAISSNMANLNTAGYRRHEVKFEEELAKAMQAGKDPKNVEAEVFQPKTAPLNKMGNDVNLASEVGDMVKNSLRHKAFIRLLKGRYNRYEQAIKTP